MLTKWSFPLFFFYPFIITIYKAQFFNKIIKLSNTYKDAQFQNILLSLIVAFFTCSFWYLPNLSSIIKVFMLSAPGSEVVPLFGLDGVFNF